SSASTSAKPRGSCAEACSAIDASPDPATTSSNQLVDIQIMAPALSRDQSPAQGVEGEIDDMGAAFRDPFRHAEAGIEGAAQRVDIGKEEEGDSGDRQVDLQRVE